MVKYCPGAGSSAWPPAEKEDGCYKGIALLIPYCRGDNAKAKTCSGKILKDGKMPECIMGLVNNLLKE